MAISNILAYAALALTLAGCGKNSASGVACENNNRVFIYSNNYFSITPNVDSFSFGQSIEIKMSLPKKFIDEAYNRNAEFIGNHVSGTLTISLLDSSRTGAVPYIEFNAPIGQLQKDSVLYDTEYFRSRNLAATAISAQSDSVLKAHFVIKPIRRGDYILNFTLIGGKNPDCSRVRYYVKPGSNQHLYLLAAANNGYIGDFAQTYAYCFKVY
jgi:hypothetical protein